MHISETKEFLRDNDCQENLSTQVILKLMRYHELIIAEIEHWRGIGATYDVPIRGVVVDDKIPKLKYYGPILV